MWDLIVSVPDHCLSFYFLLCTAVKKNLDLYVLRDQHFRTGRVSTVTFVRSYVS